MTSCSSSSSTRPRSCGSSRSSTSSSSRIDLVRRDRLVEVHKNLSRVSRIQAVMTLSWDVLATLTPTDYMTFRSVLGTSSGFQSAQFRQVEYLLGLKDGAHLKFQDEGSAEHAALAEALAAPEPVGRGQCRARPRRLPGPGRGAGAGLDAEISSPSKASSAPGPRSIATRRSIGPSTSSPRNWSTSTTASQCGGTSMW